MTETPPDPAPAPPRESLGERVSDLFHREAPVIEAAAAPLLRGHSAQLLRAAADLLEQHPGTEAIASRILEAALGVAKVAGIAL